MNLNDSNEFTLENTARLLASKDDSRRIQLRVGYDGKAFLSDEIGNINIDKVAFGLQSWMEGTSHVGTAASEDEEWVGRVFNCLQNNWPNPTGKIVDEI